MLHHPFLHRPMVSKNDLGELYIAGSLRAFAIGLVGIFIPIYLYKQNWDISAIVTFYMVFLVYSLCIAVFLGEYATRFGAKHLMAVSFAFSFISLAFLGLNNSYLMVFGLVAPTYAIAETAFWIGHNLILTEAKETGRVGSAIARFNIFAGIAAAFGPLIGGFIGEHYGLRTVFVWCLVFLFAAMWPLFETRERLVGKYFKLSRLKKDKYLLHDMLIYGFGTIANFSILIMWPILIYQKTGGLAKTGIIVAISLIITTLGTWEAGKFNDDHKGRKVRKIGAVIGIVAPFIMIWSPNIIILTIAATAGYVAQMLCVVPRASSIIQRAVKSSPIEYITVAFIGAYAPKLLYLIILLAVASSGVGGTVLLNFAVALGGVTAAFYYKNL